MSSELPVVSCIWCGKDCEDFNSDICFSCNGIVKRIVADRPVRAPDPNGPHFKTPELGRNTDYDPYIKLSSHHNGGWGRIFEVNGGVKCLLCDGLAENDYMCPECRDIIAVLRNGDVVDKIRLFFEDEDMAAKLDLLARKAVEEWVKDALSEK
jgi:hypothetical protein